MTTLATLKNIQKNFDGQSIFHLKELLIEPQKCLIIGGDNGSGKSTLLKIIGGLIDANGGSIDFQNQTFPAQKRHPLSLKSVYLSSKPYLFDLTIWDNIAYPLFIKNPRGNYQDKIQKMLDWAGLTHLKNRHPHKLSSGEKQRVALARAAILNPDIWLLDEPTEHLDLDARNQLYLLLNQLLVAQKSIIIATHAEEILHKILHQKFRIINQKLEKC